MKKKTLGIILVIAPMVSLPLVLVAYGISSFVLSQPGNGGTLAGVIGGIVNVVLALFGLAAVLGILIGIPFGIYLLTRKSDAPIVAPSQHPRYQGLTPEEIRVVTKWSWSAFLFPFGFAIGNKMWSWFGALFVPFWNFYAWIKLSSNGRRMAWEQSSETVSAFQRRQKIIAWVIVGILALWIGDSVVGIATGRPLRRVSCSEYVDADGDEIPNAHESLLGTDPKLADSDADGQTDFAELLLGSDPTGTVKFPDADGDGIADRRERLFYGSNENDSDTDDDGINDLDEVRAGMDPDGAEDMKRVLSMYALKVDIALKNCQK